MSKKTADNRIAQLSAIRILPGMLISDLCATQHEPYPSGYDIQHTGQFVLLPATNWPVHEMGLHPELIVAWPERPCLQAQ
jgi:hypothetical protein